MGVDAKLFVVAGQDQALEIGNTVQEELYDYISYKVNYAAREHGYKTAWHFLRSTDNRDANGKPQYRFGTNITSHDFYGFTFSFLVDGEDRMLWYHTDCSCDTDHITKEHTLLFSIGHWGHVDEIMLTVAESLKEYGEVWYDHNDCDDEDYVRIY